jgi:protein-histidine N-methyltransferase
MFLLTDIKLASLPSQISYSTLLLNSTADACVTGPGGGNATIVVGRRELFDMRAQLMAEDGPDHDELIASVDVGDVQPRVYEGGLKTWECALDLARSLLADVRLSGNETDLDEEFHVIEV